MKTQQQVLDLLDQFNLVKDSHITNKPIVNITYDSRETKENSLFFCKGAAFKESFLDQSIENGIGTYISEIKYDNHCDYIIVSDVRLAMLEVARWFYDYPDKELVITAITGTKGKSSSVMYLKSILDEGLDKPAGLISGITIYNGQETIPSVLTTPEALELYKHLAIARDSGLTHFIIEASSQAFKYYRINNVEVDIAVFLNFARDHVSPIEHPTFEDYFESKLKIFDHAKVAIVNEDMTEFERVINYLQHQTLYTFSMSHPKATMYCEKYSIKNDILTFNDIYQLKQLGAYNIENAMSAILVANFLDIKVEAILTGLLKAQISGREEIVKNKDHSIVALINFAHNGLSFKKSFEFIKHQYPEYKIISLFGCPGDRAHIRIEEMAQEANIHSDEVYLIPDDPGYRDIQDIHNDFKQYLTIPTKTFMTRQEGIKEAVKSCTDKTVLFIAGKGTETFQKIKGQKVPMVDDITLTKQLLRD